MAGDVTRLSVGIFASSEEFERAIENIGRDLDGFKAKAQQAGVAANLMGKNVGLGAGASGDAIKLNTFQLQNMQFQMQDLAIGLASGQSPFRVMAQQGSQIVQIFGPRTGVQAALKAVGAGIVQFVSNPLNIALLGFTAAAAIVGLLTKNLFKSSTAIRDLDGAVGDLNKALEGVGGETRNLAKDTDDLTEAQIRLREVILANEIAGLEKDLANARKALAGKIPVDAFGRLGAEANEARDEIVAAFKKGEVSAAALFERLEKLGFGGKPLRLLAADLNEVADAEANLQNALRQSSAAGREAARAAGRDPFAGLKSPKAPRLKSEVIAADFEKALDPIIKATRNEREKLEAERDRLGEILDKFAAALDADPVAADALERALAEVGEQMDALEPKIIDFKRAAVDAGEGIADAFAGAIVFGERLDKTLARLAQRLAFEALSNILFSALKAPFGGKAGGGRIGPGVATLVGERGPEIIVPQRPATVINAADSRRLSGGASVVVNQTIAPNFAGNAATQDDLRLMGQITREAAIAGTMAALRRPRFA